MRWTTVASRGQAGSKGFRWEAGLRSDLVCAVSLLASSLLVPSSPLHPAETEAGIPHRDPGLGVFWAVETVVESACAGNMNRHMWQSATSGSLRAEPVRRSALQLGQPRPAGWRNASGETTPAAPRTGVRPADLRGRAPGPHRTEGAPRGDARAADSVRAVMRSDAEASRLASGRCRVPSFTRLALPPRSFGTRFHAVRLQRADEGRWHALVDQHPLPATFASEGEAQKAVAAEVVRLDAVAIAVLRRIRSRSSRKQPSSAAR